MMIAGRNCDLISFNIGGASFMPGNVIMLQKGLSNLIDHPSLKKMIDHPIQVIVVAAPESL